MTFYALPALFYARLVRQQTQVPSLCLRLAFTATMTSTRTTSTSIPPAASIPPSGAAPELKRPLTKSERDFLDRALRVNHAGEVGANLIYEGQMFVFKSNPRLRPLIQHMWDQEIHHLKTFNQLLAKYRVRPTAMMPVWNVAGYALGVGTALLGEKAAMACTEAVETEIGEHYNNQLRELLKWVKENPELEGGEISGLIKTIRQFRDDELEHLDTAVEHDAKGAEGYEILHNVIRGGCKAAIWISERV